MSTTIYLDDRVQVTRVEGSPLHNGKCQFVEDGTGRSITTVEFGRMTEIHPFWVEHFSELIRIYHQYEEEQADDGYYRMTLDSPGRARAYIRYSENEFVNRPNVLEYYDDNSAGAGELLLRTDARGDLLFAAPRTPLWLIRQLVQHSLLWYFLEE